MIKKAAVFLALSVFLIFIGGCETWEGLKKDDAKMREILW